MRLTLALAASVALIVPAGAMAQTAGTTDTKSLTVTGNVPAICTGGTVSGGNGTYDLGVLVDTSTGFLRSTLSAPAKVLSGSFCSSRSTIEVAATPMTAQNFAGTAPGGFSRAVNYVATASGWTETAASFDTGAASNPAALQSRGTAFSGDISVAIGGFATVGGNALRLVSDSQYRGTVTVTLTAAE